MQAFEALNTACEVEFNMRILRLYYNDYLQKSTSKFYLIFKNLINKMDNSFWILTNDAFKLPIDWYPDSESDNGTELNEFYSAVISKKAEYVLVDNGFIERYGVYIKDDWNELMCFYGDSRYFEKVVELMNALSAEDLKNLVLNKEAKSDFNFEFLLSNWDSIYWELITERDVYYEDLLASIQDNEGINFEEIAGY